MATTNPVLTPEWSVLVTAGDEFFLTLLNPNLLHDLLTQTVSGLTVEVAVADTETVPTVAGHVLRADYSEGLTRDLLGPGHVYARTRRDSVVVALTAWTPV